MNQHNQKYRDNTSSFLLSLSKNADEPNEFFEDSLNYYLEENEMRIITEKPVFPSCSLEHLKYTVNPVMNQKRCASCFAIAALSSCEGIYYKKTQKLLKLSDQQMVDCTNNEQYGNKGCRGGKISGVYNYLMKNFAMNASSYPYEAKDLTCKYDASKGVLKIKDFTRFTKINENYLKDLLCTIGPIAVGIDASSKSFQLYQSGIFDDIECKSNVNHAMVRSILHHLFNS